MFFNAKLSIYLLAGVLTTAVKNYRDKYSYLQVLTNQNILCITAT
jgi:hypothetical protein